MSDHVDMYELVAVEGEKVPPRLDAFEAINAKVAVPFVPGVFFNMPEDTYHAIFALSNSGITHMRISTMDFWARSHLNPNRENPESEFMELGKAYDKRIIEGRAAFYANYAPALDPGAYPNCLTSVDDIKAAIGVLGQKPKGKRKEDFVTQLLELDPAAQVWDRLKEDHAELNAGKSLLDPTQIARIEIAAAMIENDPDLKRCFSGGYPQVSIFWYDQETGCPMKSRLDYLKARAIIDLKTFGNPLGKPIDRAIAGAMASGKYHVQAATYHQAVEQLPALIRDGLTDWGAPNEFLEALCQKAERRFVFVFQQTGIAPVARGKVFPKGLVYDCGVIAMRDAQVRFADCISRYGTDPWIDSVPLGAFSDEEFPAYMTE